MATVVHVPIERLVLTPNPVPEQDYQPILESISQFGLQYPLLVVKSEDGYYHIVDGRTRYKALKYLKWKEVPCIVVDNPEIVSLLVELYRRHLDSKTLENLKKSMLDGICNEAEEKLKTLKGLFASETIELLEKSLSEDVYRGWKEICKLYDYVMSIDTKTLQGYLLSTSQLAKEKEMAAQRVVELEKNLQDKIQKLEQALTEKRRIKEEYEELKKSIKSNFDALVNQKAQELMAAANASTAEKYEEIRKKVQEDLEEKYRRQLHDMAEQINERNKTVKELVNSKSLLEDEIEKLKGNVKDLNKFVQKIESDYRNKENIIRKALSPSGVVDKINRTESELIAAHREIMSLIDYLNLLSESSLTRLELNASQSLENLKRVYSDVGKSINELEKTVRALFKDAKKDESVESRLNETVLQKMETQSSNMYTETRY